VPLASLRVQVEVLWVIQVVAVLASPTRLHDLLSPRARRDRTCLSPCAHVRHQPLEDTEYVVGALHRPSPVRRVARVLLLVTQDVAASHDGREATHNVFVGHHEGYDRLPLLLFADEAGAFALEQSGRPRGLDVSLS
jgi:hypothetical protein